jgi:hypothetical protein
MDNGIGRYTRRRSKQRHLIKIQLEQAASGQRRAARLMRSAHIDAHPVFLPIGQRAFFVCRRTQIEPTLPRLAVGELTMPEAEKPKRETRESRPTDDGYLTPTPPKKKIIEPGSVASVTL